MGFVSHHQKFAVWFCSLTLSVHFSVTMCFTMAARVSSLAKFVCRILQDGKDLVLGANVSQSSAIEELQKPSQPQPFHRMADHLLRIAGIPPSSPLWALPVAGITQTQVLLSMTLCLPTHHTCTCNLEMTSGQSCHHC